MFLIPKKDGYFELYKQKTNLQVFDKNTCKNQRFVVQYKL